tara:strand:+ start:583 stop:696 length:114 start_codon:yes stop_codon:yes gene_type:complete
MEAVPHRRLCHESDLPGDPGGFEKMDDANQELKNGTE